METTESLKLIAFLETENALLKQQVSLFQSHITSLTEEINSLKGRLSLDSTTSHKPPSSDGLKKRTTSLRASTGLSVGGQVGHKGFTLKRVALPDTHEEHRPIVCEACEAPLVSDAEHVETRQVFDIPLPKVIVHEHRGLHIRCSCGRLNKGKFPPNVTSPTQYGSTLRARAVYYHVEQLLPMQRTAQVMRDIHHLPISVGTVAQILAEKGQEFTPQAEAIKAKLLEAPVKHLDETGVREGGKTKWLHSVSDAFLTYLRLDDKRGAVTQINNGIVVHDHWKPYFKLEGVAHALCNAHIERELNALIEINKEDWAKEMRELLLSTVNLVSEAREKSHKSLSASELETLSLRYDTIVKQGLDFHMAKMVIPTAPKQGTITRAKGHNLLNRLKCHKDDVLRFAHNFAVPFTNNQAERDIRMLKVKQKISGCFRTRQGANTFLTLKSVLASAKKQGLNAINILTNAQNLNLSPLPSLMAE